MRSPHTRARSKPAKTADPLVETLERYVSDLRLLLDQAAEREKALLAMVQELMHTARREPIVVSRQPGTTLAPISPAVPIEALSDSPEFDKEGDSQLSATEQKAFEEAEREFKELLSEENTYRTARGAAPVELEVQTA